jgi:hypothetical protein
MDLDIDMDALFPGQRRVFVTEEATVPLRSVQETASEC